MALTPEMVANKRFTPVRLREGYDMGEVDSFLDEVEEELNRLDRGGVSSEELDSLKEENEALGEKLKQVHGAYQVAEARVAALEEELAQAHESLAQAQNGEDEVVEEGLPVVEEVVVDEPVEEEVVEEIEEATAFANWPPAPVTTTEEASTAARRLLELAANLADELVTETNEKVEALRVEAEQNADETVGAARTEAEAAVAAAQSEAEALLASAQETREEVLANLEAERQTLAGAVQTLQTFENDYRASLADYFAQQLAGVQGTSVAEEVMTRYEDVALEENVEVSDEAAAEEEVVVEDENVDATNDEASDEVETVVSEDEETK